MSSVRFLQWFVACVFSTIMLSACGGCDEPQLGYYKINTFDVTDSVGYQVGKGVAYAKVTIDDPSGLSELCKKNYAMWVSTVLEIDPTNDKEAIKSLATAYAQKEALRNQAIFLEKKDELARNLVREIYTRVSIHKLYEDKEFITFMKDATSFKGDMTVSHSSVGYTFQKSDFSLAELIEPEDVKDYREQITREFQRTLVKKPEQLLDYLFIEEDCKKEGLVPLPANGAFLEDDSLVFIYQEYEIAPYKAGMPRVKLPFKHVNILQRNNDSVRISRDSIQKKEKSSEKPSKSDATPSKSAKK